MCLLFLQYFVCDFLVGQVTLNKTTYFFSQCQSWYHDTFSLATSNITIKSLYLYLQTVETLTGQVMHLAQAQNMMRQPGVEDCLEKVLSKIENLTARLVLLENRMSIVESKVGYTSNLILVLCMRHNYKLSRQEKILIFLIGVIEDKCYYKVTFLLIPLYFHDNNLC